MKRFVKNSLLIFVLAGTTSCVKAGDLWKEDNTKRKNVPQAVGFLDLIKDKSKEEPEDDVCKEEKGFLGKVKDAMTILFENRRSLMEKLTDDRNYSNEFEEAKTTIGKLTSSFGSKKYGIGNLLRKEIYDKYTKNVIKQDEKIQDPNYKTMWKILNFLDAEHEKIEGVNNGLTAINNVLNPKPKNKNPKPKNEDLKPENEDSDEDIRTIQLLKRNLNQLWERRKILIENLPDFDWEDDVLTPAQKLIDDATKLVNDMIVINRISSCIVGKDIDESPKALTLVDGIIKKIENCNCYNIDTNDKILTDNTTDTIETWVKNIPFVPKKVSFPDLINFLKDPSDDLPNEMNPNVAESEVKKLFSSDEDDNTKRKLEIDDEMVPQNDDLNENLSKDSNVEIIISYSDQKINEKLNFDAEKYEKNKIEFNFKNATMTNDIEFNGLKDVQVINFEDTEFQSGTIYQKSVTIQNCDIEYLNLASAKFNKGTSLIIRNCKIDKLNIFGLDVTAGINIEFENVQIKKLIIGDNIKNDVIDQQKQYFNANINVNDVNDIAVAFSNNENFSDEIKQNDSGCEIF